MIIDTIRIGIVGLGANTRLRHAPGLLACDRVEIAGVCNRRPESTAAAAAEFGIAKTYASWDELVDDSQIDAVVVGTWPYLHCPITLAALSAGKHVLTEARMACSVGEARQMLAASQARPELVAQIVPSPLGLWAGGAVRRLLAEGFIGALREVVVLGVNDAVADPSFSLHWRQSARLSGVNMLALGIMHEALIRWTPDPVRVLAQTATFTERRRDPQSDEEVDIDLPDCLHLLAELPGKARALYHMSGAAHFGPGMQIHLYGSEGTLKYEFAPQEQLLGARAGEQQLQTIEPRAEEVGAWRVERDFVEAMRGEKRIELTDFATGVRYMEFTEAAARSAATGAAVDLPLSV